MGNSDLPRAACSQLATDFPDKVLRPSDSAYARAQSNYWAVQQSHLTPACRFLPESASDLQHGLRYLDAHNASFAVVSGGHSSNTGASNIQDGITIDLSRLAEITLSEDQLVVWIGPGARWRDVYTALERHDLVVSGGRVAHVGVGGYLLGGGFSWFANERGWTCDGVLAFEVVVPNGDILYVSQDEHSDLFWALKGSLGSIGIVTRIKVPTIKGTAAYAGVISYPQSSVPELFRALNELAVNAPHDPNTQGYLSFGWSEKYNTMGTSACIVNTRGDDTSKAFRDFVEIPNMFIGLRPTTLRASAEEIDESNKLGQRRSKFTLTTACDVETMQLVYNILTEVMANIDFELEEMMGTTFQPLTVSHLKAQSNIFNLPPQESPLLLMSFELWWSQAGRSDYYEQQMRALHDKLTHALDGRGVLHPFVYPNYAAAWQEPFASLSEATKEKMKAIKRIYDPRDVWRRLVPGIWHL